MERRPCFRAFRRLTVAASPATTFPLRYTWLPKAVANVARDPYVFLKEDAMVTLGVGKNMVAVIRHWGLACGMLEEDDEVSNNRGRALRVSDLGNRLFGEGGWDPYLEDPATLWVIHYESASAPERATTWYWAFNHLPQSEFTKAELSTWLHRLVQERGWTRVSPRRCGATSTCFSGPTCLRGLRGRYRSKTRGLTTR